MSSPTEHRANPGTTTPTARAGSGAGEGEDKPVSAIAGGASLLQSILFMAMIAYVWRYGADLVSEAALSVRTCAQAGGDISCMTSPEVWKYVLWPVTSLIAAYSLFRGAMVANARGQGHGIALTLTGFAALGVSLLWAWN